MNLEDAVPNEDAPGLIAEPWARSLISDHLDRTLNPSPRLSPHARRGGVIILPMRK